MNKKIYFLSDAHLGSRIINDPKGHEKKIVAWLDTIKADASVVYLLGDIFDFWYEYRTVVPKGYVRFLGKLAELVDAGIEIHFFIGNHDLWTFGYLRDEIGLIVHYEPDTVVHADKTFYLAHGDGLNTTEKGFKLLRSIFHSRICQRLFRLVPPQIGQEFGFRWSKSNRIKILRIENTFLGENKEHLVLYAKKHLINHPVDYFVFGHRHILLDFPIGSQSHVIILGDFIDKFSYGVFDGVNFELKRF